MSLRVPHSDHVFVRRSIALVGVLLIVLSCFCFRTTAQEDPTFGTWTMGNEAPGNLLATHATLLRNNKILVVGGSSFNCCFHWGHEETRLYDIATGTWRDHLYQRHVDGRIWRYVGPPCSGEICPGWRQLDNNPRTLRITVGGFN